MPAVVDAVARLAPLIVGVLALGGVGLTVHQKAVNDRRDQWWKRVQWAADLVSSADPAAQQIGLAALTSLIESSDTPSAGDAQLLDAIIDVVLNVEDSEELGLDSPSPEGLDSPSPEGGEGA